METNKERSGSLKLPEHGAGVGQGIEARVVALEGAHEGLRHAVGFGTRDWREARNQVELASYGPDASKKRNQAMKPFDAAFYQFLEGLAEEETVPLDIPADLTPA